MPPTAEKEDTATAPREAPWGVVQWGMIIDADRCTGCKACVIACRSENNIATVGAEAAAMGRMVDWIRIERLFNGDGDELTAIFVPMICQHCGTAPCESVCPVFASVHTHDGLNGQVYNRCIGTRLCGNNCPYHVRMYNFVQPKWPRTMENFLNPDVTVRNEGVMEKCTFCIQRIRRADLDAKVSEVPYKDGNLRTACVQACPTSALLWGDLNDKSSSISRYLEEEMPRTYRAGEENHTYPNVIYLRPKRDPNALEAL